MCQTVNSPPRVSFLIISLSQHSTQFVKKLSWSISFMLEHNMIQRDFLYSLSGYRFLLIFRYDDYVVNCCMINFTAPLGLVRHCSYLNLNHISLYFEIIVLNFVQF